MVGGYEGSIWVGGDALSRQLSLIVLFENPPAQGAPNHTPSMKGWWRHAEGKELLFVAPV